VGELVSRLSSDVTLVRTALTNNLATVLGQAITFLGSLVLMLVLNWRLSLFILVLAPLLVAAGVVFGAQLRRLSTVVQDQLADGTAMAEEALSGVRVVKAFTREPYEAQRYATQMERAFAATMRLTRVRSAFGPLLTFLGVAALAGVLWFGGARCWRSGCRRRADRLPGIRHQHRGGVGPVLRAVWATARALGVAPHLRDAGRGAGGARRADAAPCPGGPGAADHVSPYAGPRARRRPAATVWRFSRRGTGWAGPSGAARARCSTRSASRPDGGAVWQTARFARVTARCGRRSAFAAGDIVVLGHGENCAMDAGRDHEQLAAAARAANARFIRGSAGV
jgi:hypothetical protein